MLYGSVLLRWQTLGGILVATPTHHSTQPSLTTDGHQWPENDVHGRQTAARESIFHVDGLEVGDGMAAIGRMPSCWC